MFQGFRNNRHWYSVSNSIPFPLVISLVWGRNCISGQANFKKYLINLLSPHLVCVGSDVPQCVASVGGVLKAVKKGVLHPESTPGGNGSWERAAEEYFLFWSEFHKGEPAHNACPWSLIFISFSILTGIEINKFWTFLYCLHYKSWFHSTIRENLTLEVSVEKNNLCRHWSISR